MIILYIIKEDVVNIQHKIVNLHDHLEPLVQYVVCKFIFANTRSFKITSFY